MQCQKTRQITTQTPFMHIFPCKTDTLHVSFLMLSNQSFLPELVPALGRRGLRRCSLLLADLYLSHTLLLRFLLLGLLLGDNLNNPLHVQTLEAPLILAVFVGDDAEEDAGANRPV